MRPNSRRRRSCNDLTKMKAAIEWGECIFTATLEDNNGEKMTCKERVKYGPRQVGTNATPSSPYNFNWDDESTLGEQSVRAKKVYPSNEDKQKTQSLYRKKEVYA